MNDEERISGRVDPPPGPSDGELIVQFRTGRAEAFGALVRRYERGLAAFLYHMVQDEALADDLFQETFIRILRTLPGYREQGRFKAWMFGIARNLALDALRRHRFEQELFHRPAPTEPGESDPRPLHEGVADLRLAPDLVAERKEWGERLEAAVAKLPPEQREVLMLRYAAGLTFRQIADITGTSINTALGRMRYATAALRKRLGMIAGMEDGTDGRP